MNTPALLSINNLRLPQLQIEHFTINQGECWAVLGRNGAGKQHLAELLIGQLTAGKAALTHRFRNIHLLSFEQQQAFYEQELHDDDSEFMEGADNGTTVAELLALNTAQLPEQLHFLKLDNLLDRGFRLLSSGEARKALLAQALLCNPDLLILDEPFDSLDSQTLTELNDFFRHLPAAQPISLIFLLNSLDDIRDWHSHIALIDQGRMIAQGASTQMMQDEALQALLRFDASTLPDWPVPLLSTVLPKTLINLQQATVRYGATTIFQGIDLSIEQGQHTLLTGANGSGKSTLLGLLSGDHPQCYSNNLTIFGKRRGSGESVWSLKKHIGIVSSSLHRDHRVPGSALEIVCSGFHDSIGLYDRVSSEQIAHARLWLELTGMIHNAATAFRRLSYGEQRLVLIARALVKQPALLILDEPTLGLDDINRLRVMYFLEHLGSQTHTTIVMASHRQDEQLPLFRQHLHLG